jgi:hypothetical protein
MRKNKKEEKREFWQGTVQYMLMHLIMVAIVIAVSTSIAIAQPQATASNNFQISLDNTEYSLNSLVKISLIQQNFYSHINDSSLSLEIYLQEDPTYYFKYLDLRDSTISFIPQRAGEYTVKLFAIENTQQVPNSLMTDPSAQRLLLSEKSFTVSAHDISTVNSQISQNNALCKPHVVGETLTIDLKNYFPMNDNSSQLPKNITMTYVDTSGNIQNFKYQHSPGDSQQNVIAYPNIQEGLYTLYGDGNTIDCFRVAAVEDNTLSNVGSIRILNGQGYTVGLENQLTPLELSQLEKQIKFEKSTNLDDAYIQSHIENKPFVEGADSNTLKNKLFSHALDTRPSFLVTDTRGNYLNTYFVIRDTINKNIYEGNILEIQDVNLSPSNYDVDIYFGQSTIKKMSMHSIRETRGIDMHIEDIPVAALHARSIDVHSLAQAFAIDPTGTDFASAEITFSSQGRDLLKCKEYDFTNRICSGTFDKVLDTVPNKEYTFSLTKQDPVFVQTTSLTNGYFDANTNNWTTLTDTTGAGLAYNWVSSDAGQSGVAEIANTAKSKSHIGSYYQSFNLSIPSGTNITEINFSVMWRISTYDQPGNVSFMIQNNARSITYCNFNQSFSGTTSWTSKILQTGTDCFVSNFTVNTNYTFRLRCFLNTGATLQDERCHWDNATVNIYYNDTASPTILTFNDTPDPVNYGSVLNFTANVTDNIAVDTVWVLINGSNYTMTLSNGKYYYDQFNTSIYPQLYFYTIFANDTSNNRISNSTQNVTINDSINPRIVLINPQNGYFSKAAANNFTYNVSDESTIFNCSLSIDNLLIDTNSSIIRNTNLSFNASLTYGLHYWNITCFDNSTNKNRNTSLTRNITVDTILPNVTLNSPANATWISGGISQNILFNFSVKDDYIANCSLYLNSSGSWAINQTNSSIVNNTNSTFVAPLTDAWHLWNVYCCDLAGNCAFGSSNRTVKIDSSPPFPSNENATPVNNSVYTYPSLYQFNMTWNDTLNPLSIIVIEHNFSGTLANYSTNNISNNYFYAIGNLSAGVYQYRWYANDSLNNRNASPIYYYTIKQANATMNLLLNGTAGNIVVNEGSSINISGNLSIPSSGYIELYIDGNITNSGNNSLSNITTFSQQRQYNITLLYPATINYTTTQLTRFVTVTDTQPPTVTLDNPANNSWQQRAVTFFYTPHDNLDITNCTLIIDGINNITQNATISISNNFSINVTDGTHNWTVGCSDSHDNFGFNATVKYVRVDSTPPTTFSIISPNSGTVSNVNAPLLQWTQTNETSFQNYTILVDNSNDFIFVNFVYTTFNITNTSYQVLAGGAWSDNLWYLKVIAYDLAGNANETSIVNYTVDTVSPSIAILSPSNNYYTNNPTIDFNFTISDVNEIANCSLFVNGALNDTNTSINKSTTQTFRKTFNTQTLYNWSVNCYDQAANLQSSSVRFFTVDQTNPSVFPLLSPANNSYRNSSTVSFSWNQSNDTNFANYSLQLSDNISFPYINYSNTLFPVQNTSYNLSGIVDGVWYWRVIASDLASNTYTTLTQKITIDTTAPSSLSLLAPANNTASTNQTPLLNWSTTSDVNFANYTVQIADNTTFTIVNYTASFGSISNLSYQTPLLAMNQYWYWRVIAYDLAGNAFTSNYFAYITDNTVPSISLISPLNNGIWNTSSLVDFIFNVSDVASIPNCSLIVNGQKSLTSTSITKGINQTISYPLGNGVYNWSINCTDAGGIEGNSTQRAVTVNVTYPFYKYWVSSDNATAALSPPAKVNLSLQFDGTENSVTQTVNAVDYNMANATISFDALGFILYANTLINFSSVFIPTANNRGFVSWGLYKSNASGTFTICETPNGTNGVSIPTRNVKNTAATTCVSPASDMQFQSNDNLTMRISVYGNPSSDFTLYMDNGNPSFVSFRGYKRGILNITLVNVTDQRPGEDYSFIEQCNVSCVNGYCLNTFVYLQLNNSVLQNFTNIGTSGNVILNGTQVNPIVLGNINDTVIINASLYGSNYSANNSFRCIGTSTYSNTTSNIKNITVTDITPPSVGLVSPANNFGTSPGAISFSYIPFDKRLGNCSLYTNVSGSWVANQTNTSPLNSQTNSFTLNLTYGTYLWNVQCCDIIGNCASNNTNRTLKIAGDLAIANGDISFSNKYPAENENITVFGLVRNIANKTEQNVLIRFYEGDPDNGGFQIGTDRFANLSALGNKTVNVTWTAKIGNYSLYAKIDPLDSIVESDETNNKAFNTTYTSGWQIYYGNFSGKWTLGNAQNKTVSNWSIGSSISANIYVSDSDSAISWSALKAISRDKFNAATSNTLNDFEDIDLCLGMENLTDSTNITYSSNGNPRTTSTYTIFTNSITNVPDANSTNNTNFQTGILWDADDSSDDVYSCQPNHALREDLVFVTRVNPHKTGAYGTYDYEIRVPAKLRSYKDSSDTVSFYYEIK